MQGVRFERYISRELQFKLGPMMRLREPGKAVQVDEDVCPSGVVPPGKEYDPFLKSSVTLVPATTPNVSR